MQEIRTRLMGIVNLTPDSFSDGGSYVEPERALAHMEALVDEGADILDIGAESTRPGAQTLSLEEEWARLEPVLAQVKARLPHTPISLDTRNAATAEKALACGVDIINDVSGGKDKDMLQVIAAAACRYVVMHSLSVPADPAYTLPDGVNATIAIYSWAEQKLQDLYDAGIDAERLIFDPGIGFGKTAEQSWNLLRGMPVLMELDAPWLVGHSRKSFFKLVGEQDASERDMETQMVTAWLARCGVQYIRIHDVAGAKRALAVGRRLRKGEQQ